MNWYCKVAAFKLLSTVPGGRKLYRFTQERVTKSLVPSRARVNGKVEVAAQYLAWLTQHQQLDRLLQGVHLDFGSGWHPTIPLFLYSLGVERQHLFDVVPVLDGHQLQQTLRVFLDLVNEPQFPHRKLLRRLPSRFEQGDWQQHLEGLGLSYHAPYAEVFPTLAGQVDVVTSTQVLLHVPPAVMPWCFEHIHQSLKPGGLFLTTIHLRDILAGLFQPGLVKFNQLKYSPQTWERWICSSLMSFNRLKAPDYRGFLEKAGFELLHFEVEPGTEAELKELDQVRIAHCFKHYSREDLVARHLFFVARKR
jgi:hypothetical protein